MNLPVENLATLIALVSILASFWLWMLTDCLGKEPPSQFAPRGVLSPSPGVPLQLHDVGGRGIQSDCRLRGGRDVSPFHDSSPSSMPRLDVRGVAAAMLA